MTLLAELKRRNVIRVAAAYLVAAWLVVQVTEIVTGSFGAPDWVMQILIVLMAVGLPFAVIIAWAYEMTPEGLKREKDVDRSASITRQTGQKLNYAIIGVLAVALVLSLATRDWSPGSSGPAMGEKSIAVLPFVNMSDDQENEYFSDGISEELLNVLVKVDGLRVASRTSSFSFKGTNKPIPEIAEALKVEHVLEGSVRKAGDTIRITAQLIDVRTDSHLWSETYDRKFEDIFVIQDEISAHIVDALKVALGAGTASETLPRPTGDLDAYENYLKGRYLWQLRGEANIRKSLTLFRAALDGDPEFARAWSGLAAAHITMPLYSGEPDEDHLPPALEYAEKALELDPSIAEAHAVLGDILRTDKHWLEADRHYRKAIELEPKNPTGYLWFSEHLQGVGLIKESLANALKCQELDPYNLAANARVALVYRITGDFDRARSFGQTSWELGYKYAPLNLLSLAIYEGDFDEALRWADEAEKVLGNEAGEMLRIRIEARRSPAAINRFLEAQKSSRFAGTLGDAMTNASFGRLDVAFGLLDGAAIGGGGWLGFWEPNLRALRADPRFGELLKENGLVDYWDQVGWPEGCSRNGENVTCD